MSKADKLSLTVGAIGITLAILSLAMNFNDRAERAKLEKRFIELRLTTPIFTVERPAPGIEVPARQKTEITGRYFPDVPPGYQVRAVLSDGDQYHVSRYFVQMTRGAWSSTIMPWPGRWWVHICLANSDGAAAIDKWAKEKTPQGEINYNNVRNHLPDGVFINSTFSYTAVDVQG
jgi:hypothetical protein